MKPDLDDFWAYESIVSGVPGVNVSPQAAVAVQFLLFESAVLLVAAVYGRWDAAIAGTVGVLVATVGSVEMVRIADRVRGERVPDAYRRLLFGSSIELVLTVFAFVALVTYLFVGQPRRVGVPLVERLLGPEPPLLGVALFLLVVWDLCYRIGTGWWASVAACWRSWRFRFDADTAANLARADLETMAFAVIQLALVPFLLSSPVLAAAVIGHVLAVLLVSGTSVLLLRRRKRDAVTRTGSP